MDKANKLFAIETDDIELVWRAPAPQKERVAGIGEYSGILEITQRRHGIELRTIRFIGTQGFEDSGLTLKDGPALHEQTNYSIFIQSKSDKPVSLTHANPNVCKSLVREQKHRLMFGTINFGSDVGLSKFTVNVDDKPEFDFVVEVFPTKLDYKSDYEQLVAEMQEYVAGLIYEYLRSTFRLSAPVLEKQTSSVEWLLLLKSVVDDLEKATSYIANRPTRDLVSDSHTTRIEKVKKLDSTLRKSILRGLGSGERIRINNLQVRQRVAHQNAAFSLHTPEHCWISTKLKRIHQRLALLQYIESQQEPNPRRNKIATELQELDDRIQRMRKLKPFAESDSLPPAGFASLRLLSATGYRECYRSCTILSLGLQIEGGHLDLSLKDISTLYEYWCYLAVVHLLAKRFNQPVQTADLVKEKGAGLEIQLKRGKRCSVAFKLEGGRRVDVTYNGTIGHFTLSDQRPDILITLKEPGWPAQHLLLDAKYRVRFEREFIQRFGAPGPDITAVNELHRYRDAILVSSGVESEKPKRTIIQAAALFPYREDIDGSFRNSKLWQSLAQMGVGAIPFLPGDKRYLTEWISSLSEQGGWSLADTAIGHIANEKSGDWRIAASEPILIGVLRPKIAAEHLQWILDNRCYYAPLHKNQKRQLTAKWVAIYVPSSLAKTGVIRQWARVINIDIKPRSEIQTPWTAGQDGGTMNVVYTLESFVDAPHVILNREGQRFSEPRWTTRLAFERATTLSELLLETEPEWKLYEQLKARGIQFKLTAAPATELAADQSHWRVWFELHSGHRIRYAGLHGFLIKDLIGAEQRVSDPFSVLFDSQD